MPKEPLPECCAECDDCTPDPKHPGFYKCGCKPLCENTKRLIPEHHMNVFRPGWCPKAIVGCWC